MKINIKELIEEYISESEHQGEAMDVEDFKVYIGEHYKLMGLEAMGYIGIVDLYEERATQKEEPISIEGLQDLIKTIYNW